MFLLWFERGVPPGIEGEMEGRAAAAGPAPGPHPLDTIAGADGVIASSVLRYEAAIFDRAPRLKVIARTGIGTELIDIPEATRRGIAVCNAPDGPTISTAEHTIALMLAVAKRLKAAEGRLRRGEGNYFVAHDGLELDGRTLGLVGFGRIGRRVAVLGTALGMEVLAHDPYAAIDPGLATESESLERLLAASDVVSLHLPLTAENRGMIGAEAIAAMRPGAVLVNAARGGLVDHQALLDALERGHLGGAGLDTTDPEPLPPGHPLFERDDVVVTPHIAAATGAGKRRLYVTAIREALAVLEGREPDHPVNPEVLEGTARDEAQEGA